MLGHCIVSSDRATGELLYCQMMKVTCDTEHEYFLQQTVYQKLAGCSMPHPKCKGSLLVDLAAELQQIKDSLAFTAGLQRLHIPPLSLSLV